jgi:hypothetical protein
VLLVDTGDVLFIHGGMSALSYRPCISFISARAESFFEETGKGVALHELDLESDSWGINTAPVSFYLPIMIKLSALY